MVYPRPYHSGLWPHPASASRPLPRQKLLKTPGCADLAKSSFVNGVISGVPGAVANVEADSLLKKGTLETNFATLESSAYQMSLFGGVFGAVTSGLGRTIKPSMLAERETNIVPASSKEVSFHSSMEPAEQVVLPALSLDHSTAQILSDEGRLRLAHDTESSKSSESVAASSELLTRSETPSTQIFTPEAADASIRLTKFLGADSPVLRNILALEEERYLAKGLADLKGEERSVDNSHLPGLAEFVENNPETNLPLLQRIAQTAKTAAEIEPDRLNAISTLAAVTGENSSFMKLLWGDSEGSTAKLSGVATWARDNPDIAASFLNRMVNLGAKPSNLNYAQLRGFSELDAVLGHKDEPLRYLIDFGVGPEKASELAKFLTEDGAPARKNGVGSEGH